MDKPVFALKYFWLAIRYFLFLNNEQTKILLLRKIEGNKSALDWVTTLDNLTKFDESADNARHTCFVLGWWTLSLSIVAYIGEIIFIKNAPMTWMEGSFLNIISSTFSIFLFLAFICWLFYFLFKRVDLENRLRLFVYPLVKILTEEGKENSLVTLNCQVAKPKSKRYKTGVKKNYTPSAFRKWMNRIMLGIISFGTLMVLLYNFMPSFPGFYRVYIFLDMLLGEFAGFFIITGFVLFFVWIFSSFGGKYPKITNTIYTYPWLSFSARMADDTVLSADFVDTLLVREVVKTNARGKVKTKYKYGLRRLTSVTIGFDKDNYNYSASSPHKGGFIQEKPNDKRHTFKIKDKEKQVAIVEKVQIPKLDKFLGLVAKAYQKVKQAA
ncbi:MAG: hypothetical protein MUC49_18105 [Raineya sp.]|jgi:hypothetical protein|nr:hypothetical protein [Raineya sp.]